MQSTVPAIAPDHEGFAPAARLGKYDILGEIGRGSMGVVYRAVDSVLERDVALKVMNSAAGPLTDMQQQFHLEARSIAKLKHPNIVTIFELAVDRDAPYIVMELLDGENLEERLARGVPNVLESLDIIKHVCHALAHAHERQLIHRDVKPANLFVTREGVVKVMDFGVVRASGPSREPGFLGGTAEYMSPEQARGSEVDHRSDVFGVGVVLYRLLTGQRPFRGEQIDATLRQVMKLSVDSVPFRDGTARPQLERIVVRALEKNVARRYQDAKELAQDIEDWLVLHAEDEEPRRVADGSARSPIEPPPMPPDEALKYLRQHTRTEADFPIVKQTAVNLLRLPEGVDISRVEEVVIQDPGLTSKILKVANSAYFNRSQKTIDSLHHAVNLLGLDHIRNACLGLGFSEAAGAKDSRVQIGPLSSRAFFGASLGRELGLSCRHRNPQEVFTGALLHNLPRMALALHLPDVFLYIERVVDEARLSRHEAERIALSVPIGKLGHAIGSQWRLSPSLVEAMGASAGSATAERARTPEAITCASAVLANALADEILSSSGSERVLQELLRGVERALGVGEGAAVEAIERAHAQAVEFAQAFGIDLNGFVPPQRTDETVRYAPDELRAAILSSLSNPK